MISRLVQARGCGRLMLSHSSQILWCGILLVVACSHALALGRPQGVPTVPVNNRAELGAVDIWNTDLQSIPDPVFFTQASTGPADDTLNPTDVWISNCPLNLQLTPEDTVIKSAPLQEIQEVPRGFIFHGWSVSETEPAHGKMMFGRSSCGCDQSDATRLCTKCGISIPLCQSYSSDQSGRLFCKPCTAASLRHSTPPSGGNR